MKKLNFLTKVTRGLASVFVTCLAAACSKDVKPSPNAAASTPNTSPGTNVSKVKLDLELKAVNVLFQKVESF